MNHRKLTIEEEGNGESLKKSTSENLQPQLCFLSSLELCILSSYFAIKDMPDHSPYYSAEMVPQHGKSTTTASPVHANVDMSNLERRN